VGCPTCVSVSGGAAPSPTQANPVHFQGMIVHAALKTFSYVVLVLMAVGIVYASYISIKYWTGISV
jgi:hypothetical protein